MMECTADESIFAAVARLKRTQIALGTLERLPSPLPRDAAARQAVARSSPTLNLRTFVAIFPRQFFIRGDSKNYI